MIFIAAYGLSLLISLLHVFLHLSGMYNTLRLSLFQVVCCKLLVDLFLLQVAFLHIFYLSLVSLLLMLQVLQLPLSQSLRLSLRRHKSRDL